MCGNTYSSITPLVTAFLIVLRTDNIFFGNFSFLRFSSEFMLCMIFILISQHTTRPATCLISQSNKEDLEITKLSREKKGG